MRRISNCAANYDRYNELLESNFNAATLDQVMCRNLITMAWDGLVYDCDFNKMLDLPTRPHSANPFHIKSLPLAQVERQEIPVGTHSSPSTAGSGSSCGGALIS